MTASTTFPVRMSRREASKYLETVHGVRRTYRTLVKLATEGDGPRFCKLGRAQVLYSREGLDAWVAEMLSEPVACAAEHRAARRAREQTAKSNDEAKETSEPRDASSA